MAILENGPDLHGELFAALVALVEADPGCLTGHLADAVETPAMRANRAVRPHASFTLGVSGGFRLEGFAGNDRIRHDTRFPLMI